MEFEEWEPVYEAIRTAFGYSRAEDRRARDRLGTMVPGFDTDRFTSFQGATVGIVGAAPALPNVLGPLEDVEYVVAASSAVPVLQDTAIEVDLMVSDLDKTPATAQALTETGTPVAVHAHGDNIHLLETWVPKFVEEHVLPTTQVEPTPPVENFGGFTDGDRAAFIADAFGAAALEFVGWDLDDPTVSDEKRQKLRWAARLLKWLELRRGEEFAILDGRRESLDLPWRD